MSSSDLHGQDCFEDYLSQGQSAYNDLQFEEALNLFNAARICPDNSQEELTVVNDWIARANNGYIDAIKAARDAALASEERALKAQMEAERQATLSEARRLADLANQELMAGSHEAALGLAYLALSSVADNTIGPVKLAFGNAVAHSTRIQMNHDAPVADLGFLGSGRIWSRSLDGSVILWDHEGGQISALGNTIETARKCVPINGQNIAWIGSDGQVEIYDEHGQLLQNLTQHKAPILAVSSVDVGSTFATADRGGTINLNNENGLLKTLQVDDPVHQVEFTRDGAHLMVRSASPQVRIYETDGSTTIDLRHDAPIYAVSESPNRDMFVSAGGDRKAILWNPAGQKITELMHNEPVTHAVFSPDGEKIATADLLGNIKIWDQSGTTIQNLQGPASGLVYLRWAPNGRFIAAADDNDRIWIWGSEVAPVAVIENHTDAILSLEYSPDSGLLLSTSQDGTAWLWDHEGQAVMQILGTENPVYKGMFSPDGQQVLVASGDNYVLSVRNPITLYAELKTNPPEFTAAQKEKFGLE